MEKEIIPLLKFIQTEYKSWDEIRKHFKWNDETAQIIWDRYFEDPHDYILSKKKGFSGPEQAYTASQKGIEYLKGVSFSMKIHRFLNSPLIVAIIVYILGILSGLIGGFYAGFLKLLNYHI